MCCCIFSPILLVACSQLLWVFVCLFECWGDAHYNYYETLNIINGMYGHYIYLYLQHSTMFGKYGFDIRIKTNLLLECGYQKILIIYLVFQIIWETLDSTTYKSSTQFKAMKKNTFMPILYDYPMKDTPQSRESRTNSLGG